MRLENITDELIANQGTVSSKHITYLLSLGDISQKQGILELEEAEHDHRVNFPYITNNETHPEGK